MNWVCLECGARRAEAGACACGEPETHDMRSEQVTDLMRDIDQRRRDRVETRARWIGVVVGCALVFGAWLIPGYWTVREHTMALPFWFDQWILMAGIGLVVMSVVKRFSARPLFPYLEA